MKVMRTLPFRPLCHLLPTRLAGLSVAFLKATALELTILAGHLLLYPSGILPERRRPLELPKPATVEPVGAAADAPRLPTADRPPVLLLHGFIDNRSVFVLLRRSLAQHGRQHIESLNYSPLSCDIRAAAALLA